MKTQLKLAISLIGFSMSAAAFCDVINLTDGGTISIGNTVVTCNATSGGSAQEKTFCRCDKAKKYIGCVIGGWLSNYPTYNLNVVSGTTGNVLFTAKELVECESRQTPEELCELEIRQNPACR